MKLGRALALTGLGIAAAGAAVANQACSSSDSSSGGTGTTSAQTGKVWPAQEGSATSSTDERTFAVNAIQLGEADRSGTKNKDAWKKYGYNLDGLITTVTDQKSADLTKVCKRADGASASIHQDGDEGTDNAFGKTILPLLDPFTPTPSKSITDAVKKGSFTLLFKLKGLSEDDAQTNTGLSGSLFVGANYGDTPPAFDKSTDWPYLKTPQVGITGAYINAGTFVNGSDGADVKLSLSFSGQQLTLTVHKAIITFKHNGSKLDDGVIAGIINTEEIITGISSIAGRFSKDLCSGKTIDGIKDSIRTASDMLTSGAQDPSQSCDGISAGIGFSAVEVGNPTMSIDTPEPPADACTSDGG